MPERWAKPDNEKLVRLFRTRVDRGGVSSTDINQKSIQKVISKHFPDLSYNAFSTLFRKKLVLLTSTKFSLEREFTDPIKEVSDIG